MNNNIIITNNLTKIYHRGNEKVFALKNVTLSVTKGEFLAVIGPSGSGKTTLLNILGCFDRPTDGVYKLNGMEVNRLRESKLTKIRQEYIGFVFQQFYLLPTLTVKENIMLPLLFSKKKNFSFVDEIIEIVGLKDRRDHLPHQLSGGEMQRVAIGRALINRPSIILADEPTGNLDSSTAEIIYKLFQHLNQNGLTFIIATHNQELANKAHRIVHLRDGEIIKYEETMKRG